MQLIIFITVSFIVGMFFGYEIGAYSFLSMMLASIAINIIEIRKSCRGDADEK